MPSANQSGGAMATRVAKPGAGPAAGPDVVLELVDHLVHQHVLEVRVRAGERQHGPVPGEVGDAAGALAADLRSRWSA